MRLIILLQKEINFHIGRKTY